MSYRDRTEPILGKPERDTWSRRHNENQEQAQKIHDWLRPLFSDLVQIRVEAVSPSLLTFQGEHIRITLGVCGRREGEAITLYPSEDPDELLYTQQVTVEPHLVDESYAQQVAMQFRMEMDRRLFGPKES